MALIGEIAVNIVARTGAFQKGMNAVRKNLNTVGNALGKFGGVVAGGLLAAAKSFSTFGDDIAKMAKRIGFSVESLSALEFAAAQSGAGLSDIEAAMRGLSKRILDVTTGTADALARLGVNVQQLQSQSPEQQFMTLSHAIAAVQDPTEKAGLAMAVFGRSATKLIPLLNEGETGMAALIAEAHDLGIVLTAQDAAAAEQLNDAFGRLGFQFKAIVKEFAVAVSGPLLQFLDRAKEIGKSTIHWIRQNQGLVITIGTIGVTATVAAGVLKTFAFIIGKVTVAIKLLTTAMVFLSAHPLVALLTLVGVGAVIAFDKLTGASKKLSEWISGVGSSADSAAGSIGRMSTEVKALSEGMLRIQQIAKDHPLFPRGEMTEDSHLFRLLERHQKNLDELKELQNPSERQRTLMADTEKRIAALEKRIGLRTGQAERAATTPEQKAASFMTRALVDGIQSAVGSVFKGIVGANQSITGGRLGIQEDSVLGKIGSVFEALRKLPTQQAEEMQEVVRGQNDIIKKGSQEAITFAARHRQQASSPDKKIEKNTADSVKVLQQILGAIKTKPTDTDLYTTEIIPAS